MARVGDSVEFRASVEFGDGLLDAPGAAVTLSEARCRATWDADATLRAEFDDDFEAYRCYARALVVGSAPGSVRVSPGYLAPE